MLAAQRRMTTLLKSATGEVVQFKVICALPAVPLGAGVVAMLGGDRLSIVSALVFVSLPAWALDPAQAVTFAVMA